MFFISKVWFVSWNRDNCRGMSMRYKDHSAGEETFHYDCGLTDGIMYRYEACNTLKEIGNGSFVCSQIRPGVFFNDIQTANNGIFDNGYEMEFVRTVNGFPIAHLARYEISP